MKPARNLFSQLNIFESQISALERKILKLEEKLEQKLIEQRHQLLRVKNRQDLPDDFILTGGTYLDLSPEKAHSLYYDKEFDFILVDVSEETFTPPFHLPEAIRIPWSDFSHRFLEIQNKSTPILIISEDGTHSVLACNFLVKQGFYNTNNISGGYKFWKEQKIED